MYPPELYSAFVSLRDQLNRLKTMEWADKYSDIEGNVKKYKTFQRFHDRAFGWIYSLDLDKTTQNVFDEMYGKSRSRKLSKYR